MKKTWQERLLKEENKLNKKVNKLAAYIEEPSSKFDELDEWDRDLLMTQHAAMTAYLNVLTMRVKSHNLRSEEDKESFELNSKEWDEFSKYLDTVKGD